MVYGDFKDLLRRISSDNILHDKHLILHSKGSCSMVYEFFHKKTSGSGIKNENISNKELAEELHKPIIKKFKERKLH